MAKFRLRDTVEASQWNVLGDHIKVVAWTSLGLCNDCGKTAESHGKIQVQDRFHKVCSGDWIVESPVHGSIPVRPHVFNSMYIPVTED